MCISLLYIYIPLNQKMFANTCKMLVGASTQKMFAKNREMYANSQDPGASCGTLGAWKMLANTPEMFANNKLS